MALMAIVYKLKIFLMTMIHLYFLAIKHKIKINYISITTSCAWSNTGCHLSR